MIKDFFIWHPGFDEGIAESIKNPNVSKINLFAGEEWELRCDWNNHSYYQDLCEFATNKELNIIVGCHETDLHKKNFICPPKANVHYWPTHWIHHTASKLKPIIHPKPQTIKKIFMSLNNKAHPHRCMMMDHISMNNLFEHGDVSWHETNVRYDFKHWKMTPMQLDEDYPRMLDSYNTLPKSFSSTLISLVAEANMKAHFVTEKTWMPVFFKRPFMIFGPQGIHREIKGLGFKLPDEIDYSFDAIEDDAQRCQTIMEVLKTFIGQDLDHLRKTMEPVLNHNYEVARELAFNRYFYPKPVLDLLQRYQSDATIPTTYHWANNLSRYEPLY